MTLAKLAERLHVQPPSLYNHVAGLPALRKGLAALAAEQLGARLTRAAVGKSGERAVIAISEAYRSFAKERPGLYAAILRAPGPDDTRYIAAAEEILDVVSAALEQYGFSGELLIDAIRGLRSIIHGFVSLGAERRLRHSARHRPELPARGADLPARPGGAGCGCLTGWNERQRRRRFLRRLF